MFWRNKKYDDIVGNYVQYSKNTAKVNPKMIYKEYEEVLENAELELASEREELSYINSVEIQVSRRIAEDIAYKMSTQGSRYYRGFSYPCYNSSYDMCGIVSFKNKKLKFHLQKTFTEDKIAEISKKENEVKTLENKVKDINNEIKQFKKKYM